MRKEYIPRVADKVLEHAQGRRALVLAPVVLGRKGEYTKLFDDLRREGFSRVRVDGEVRELGEGEIRLPKTFKHSIEVVVDRIVVREVLVLMEGTLAPVSCLEEGYPPCPRMAECRTIAMWQGLDKVIGDYLGSLTIADLMHREDDGFDYMI